MSIALQLCHVHDRLHTGLCPACAVTLPPDAADDGAAEFEARIASEGEAKARWDRLLELLDEARETRVERKL